MERRVLSAVVAVLVGIAGCSGFVADSGDRRERSAPSGSMANVTPAPVPTAADAPPKVPGLDANGVSNASRLAEAHDATLDGRSFTRQVAWTFRYPNGTFYQGRWRVTRVGEARTRYYDSIQRRGAWLGDGGSPDRVTTGIEHWSGENETVRAVGLLNGTRWCSELPAEKASALERDVVGSGGDRIARLLQGAQTRVTGRVMRDGTPVYRVGALDVARNRVPTDPDLTSPRDVSMSLLVGEGGFVRSYTVTYATRTPAGTALTVAYVVQYGQVGETAVERSLQCEGGRRTSETEKSGGTTETSTDGSS